MSEPTTTAASDNGPRMECKICWHVYDPAEGDPVWQIAPGTPFAALPSHWSCPECDSDKNGFLVISE
ncbi:rubredoxin [Halioxenophilus sp. WMMB6]|uniref:rubredoxin n=1 Tax=Halioxenophilus sp. WMMB6 TaxID=3073815 RepID=UPI00295F1649|nr:rubredoxin [Halioxenophilus sp. WMMB6]